MARWGRGVPGIASTTTPTSEVASHIRPEIRSGSGPSSWSGPRVRAEEFMALFHPRGRLRPRRLERQGATAISSSSGASRRASPGSTSSRRASRSCVVLDADRLAALGAGHRGDVDRVEGRPRRRLARVRRQLVHDRVAAVGHDQEQRSHAVARGAPQRLDGVQRRAVAEHRHHGTVGQRHPHAHGARQGEAEAAHRRAEEAHRDAGRDAGVQLGPAGGRLLDEDGVGRQARGERVEDVAGAQGLAGRRRLQWGGLGERPGLRALAPLRAADQAAADRARLGHDRQLRRAALRLGGVVGDERQARCRG